MKYITFTFDDGLIKTATLVKSLNVSATFYIVLGWILQEIKITDSFNFNLDHGTIQEWNNIELDIGCHTYDHNIKFNELLSFKKFSKFFNAPKNLATPYGIDYKVNFYDSCKVGFYKPYNLFSSSSLKKLCSINPNYDFKNNMKELELIISNCPDEHWIIFTFHGINEGWYPVEYKELEFWKNFFLARNFTFISITNGVKKLCKKYLL